MKTIIWTKRIAWALIFLGVFINLTALVYNAYNIIMIFAVTAPIVFLVLASKAKKDNPSLLLGVIYEAVIYLIVIVLYLWLF